MSPAPRPPERARGAGGGPSERVGQLGRADHVEHTVAIEVGQGHVGDARPHAVAHLARVELAVAEPRVECDVAARLVARRPGRGSRRRSRRRPRSPPGCDSRWPPRRGGTARSGTRRAVTEQHRGPVLEGVRGHVHVPVTVEIGDHELTVARARSS